MDREPLGQTVGEPEQDAEDGQEDRDLPGLAEMLLDRLFAERAGVGLSQILALMPGVSRSDRKSVV